MAAQGPDCPFTGRGPASSLQACEEGCMSDSQCNTINFAPVWGESGFPDCVYRMCTDPFNPVVAPLANYSVYSTRKTALYFDATAFTLSTVAYTEPLLEEAMVRYASGIIFAYGPGALPANMSGVTLIPGLLINVSGPAPLDDSTDESYTLAVPNEQAGGYATLTAATVYGALRGLETFCQLITRNLTDHTYSTMATYIADAPRFPYRAVMVDTGRHFLTPATLYMIMDQMAYLKLNVLHWHISDDQSFPLILNSAPLLANRSAFSNYSHTYSHTDVANIVAYAKSRGIRVIAEMDTPAHFSTLFAAYPQYAATAYDKNNNSYLCLVDPSQEATFTFLESIWTEIASIFPDSHMHIGGDEFWYCWNDAPVVAAWMKSQNFSISDAYHYYERRVIDIIRKQNKKTIAWLDIEGFPENFNNSYSAYPDVTFDVWTGCYSGDWQADTARFTSQNLSVVVSGPFYITQQNGAPNTPHFTWQQMYSTDLYNFTGGNLTAQSSLVHGGELCAWDDAAQTDSGDLWMSLSPYMIGVAEAWWSPQSYTRGQQPDETRAHVHRCRMLMRGIPSHPIFAFGTYCPVEYSPILASFD